MPATLYRTNNTHSPIVPENGTDFTLAELQAAVGGHVEIACLRDGRIMCLNEDGYALALPTNDMATVIANNLVTAERGIVGDVIICDSEMVK